LLLAIVAAVFGAAGCGGGSRSRPQTPPTTTHTISTAAGTLLVLAEGCTPDLETMTREVDGVVKRSGLTASLAGWTLYARSPEATRARCAGVHGDACHDWSERVAHVWCPTPDHRAGGVGHEVSHIYARAAGLSCWREIGHDGVDFTCRRRTR
jgi:hypothetical protein